jgi:hypothetical protein
MSGRASRARKRRMEEPSTSHENGCLGGMDGRQMLRGGLGRRSGAGASGQVEGDVHLVFRDRCTTDAF